MRIHGLLFVLAAACTSSSSTPEQNQFESALETWSVHGPSHYSFTWQRSCECSTETTAPIRITVANATITSAVYVESQQPVSNDVLTYLDTIDGVFDTIEAAVTDGAHTVVVEYSPETGHPLSVAINYEESLADEELSLQITDFVADSQASRENIGCGLAPHE